MQSPSLRSLAQACPSSGGQSLAWHPLCTPLLWSESPRRAFPSSSQWRLLAWGCSLPTDARFLPFGYWFSRVNKRREIKHKGFLGGSDGKESAMWKTWVRSLGWEDSLEKGTATQSSILTWRIPWTEEPGRLQSMGSQKVRHDWLSLSIKDKYWR